MPLPAQFGKNRLNLRQCLIGALLSLFHRDTQVSRQFSQNGFFLVRCRLNATPNQFGNADSFPPGFLADIRLECGRGQQNESLGLHEVATNMYINMCMLCGRAAGCKSLAGGLKSLTDAGTEAQF